jgi:hypothetical protein
VDAEAVAREEAGAVVDDAMAGFNIDPCATIDGGFNDASADGSVSADACVGTNLDADDGASAARDAVVDAGVNGVDDSSIGFRSVRLLSIVERNSTSTITTVDVSRSISVLTYVHTLTLLVDIFQFVVFVIMVRYTESGTKVYKILPRKMLR